MRGIFALSFLSAVLTAGAVQAADLPVKTPPKVVPVSSWTGFYVGANVGYGWGSADPASAGSGTSIFDPGALAVPNSYGFGGAHKQALNGILGGGQVGYNFQYSPKWLFGFEADIQGSGQHKSGTIADSVAAASCTSAVPPATCIATSPFIGAAVTGEQTKIDWFGTARGRVGWLVTEQTLLYATGGLAYGHVGISGNVNVSGAVPAFPFLTWGGSANGFSASKTNVGFAVGGGVEGKFTAWLPQNWSWKLEYLYLDLGSLNVSTPFVSLSATPLNTTNITGTMTYHSHFTDNVVRFGINYKFN